MSKNSIKISEAEYGKTCDDIPNKGYLHQIKNSQEKDRQCNTERTQNIKIIYREANQNGQKNMT